MDSIVREAALASVVPNRSGLPHKNYKQHVVVALK